MDLYHIWCDLKPAVRDTDFVDAARAYLDRLEASDALVSYRITRRKLGLGSGHLGEFHLQLEFANLAQLDAAFTAVSRRDNPIGGFHQAVNSKVQNVTFALYRDFPDQHCEHGEELF
jgi:hypothetical protein